MKQKNHAPKLYGLRSRFVLSIVISVLICGIVFFVLYYSMDTFLNNYSEKAGFEQTHIRMQGKSLQNFINENSISDRNLGLLKKWEYRQPVILLELYRANECIYSSFYDVQQSELLYGAGKDDSNNMVSLQLTDGPAVAFLYSDFTYQYHLLGTALSFIVSLVLFVFLFLRGNRKLIHYICRLNEEVQILEGGNLEYHVSVEGNNEITDLAKSMNRMRISFLHQMETERQLYQANKQLVTEMSHDLRTPLTGIMLYLEILRSHRYSTDSELQDYLRKIDAKAHHMKLISNHLFEYSLDNSHTKQTEPIGMEQAFQDAIDSFVSDLEARCFFVVSNLEWGSYFVQVKTEYIQRVFENIISNISKYAEPSSEIRIVTVDSDNYCGFSVLNGCMVSQQQVESNGIGIESIQTIMQQMNGLCTVEQTDMVFEITLLFPKQ
ncbi:signal transduction histidine kinase [Sphaerochaeta pleomorpha str. Grapes]|uniref:histidine kinase n=1 Tax=Sphaerochaeta pleomorpha (strain ATCC BAA-1885 / DSM 22778 / Grapes) TaxID=158190 RepID=G8QX50_SPHPG|nr:HAMP domain-containing sensor histidine kinase [Sphaerochaeta pleomorpha]AEV30635.1 signal transduction histidine kinase [Sphaerochaeta pleomorpha str. Grapes]